MTAYRFVAGSSEAPVYPWGVHLLGNVVIAGHAINTTLLSVVLAILLGWICVYLIYKIAWRADFGLPVRRRLLCARLRVERDQVAFVPLWWSDLQIQRAISAHWKSSLRATAGAASGSHAEHASPTR
jgi:hypothetical protein